MTNELTMHELNEKELKTIEGGYFSLEFWTAVGIAVTSVVAASTAVKGMYELGKDIGRDLYNMTH